ncbi:hypothetical protein [Prescottella agglutinans]|uniref:Uncharacterized protein n=1 Tax=Prescottella agglutinans TaxID=1644129 RepID=A0ABT6M9X6_9NOCA|nr:hypothetical protein [Prescottella agglutinans]MDH6281115.1 hypothetical protein [Prescottella agglutinans]
MDRPNEQIFLLAGASIAVTDAIAYAYTRRRPCVVLGDVADPEPEDGAEL